MMCFNYQSISRVLTILWILIVVLVCVNSENVNEVADAVSYCPQELLKPNDKYCLIRDKYYPEPLWLHWVGLSCYNFTDPVRFKNKPLANLTNVQCQQYSNKTFLLPILPYDKDDKNKFVFFNYTDEESNNVIKSLFRTEYFFELFLDCSKEAVNCCKNFMDNENIKLNKSYCPTVWDGWSCFPQTKVNTISKVPCSKQCYQSPKHVCLLYSEKTCYFDTNYQTALWDINTNYNPCSTVPVYKRRHQFHVTVLSISTIIAVPAIIIYLLFPRFRLDKRVIFHRNLLLSITVRNILSILVKTIIILDALKPVQESNNVMVSNGIPCRVLAFFESVAKNSIYACMLVDGYYLHKVIVRTFARDPSMRRVYLFIAIYSVVPTLIWSLLLIMKNQGNCWVVDLNGYQWIVDSCRIFVIVMNSIFLIDIVRILITKMNQGGTSRQTKAALRATIFLIPLFGLHFIITAKQIPIDETCHSEDIYQYTRYSMEALQAIMVAILFCYINNEVHNELENAWRKLLIHFNQKFGNIDGKRPAAVSVVKRNSEATCIQDDNMMITTCDL